MTYLEGVDISYAQDRTPSLAGLGFVVVKASEGNFVDPRWAQHSAAVRAAGLPLLAYHFGRSEWSVAEQLAVFESTAKSADAWALDYEPSGARTLMSEAQARQFIRDWQQHNEIGMYAAEFYPWGGYAGHHFAEPHYPSDSFGADWRWVANQGHAPGVPFDMWQYAGIGLDRDRATSDALAKILRGQPQPQPGGQLVKFIQLNAADLVALATIDIPAQTPLEDFAGEQWTTIGPTSVHVLPGLVDAHSDRRAVVVSTGRFYADGKQRPTVQVAVLGGKA